MSKSKKSTPVKAKALKCTSKVFFKVKVFLLYSSQAAKLLNTG